MVAPLTFLTVAGLTIPALPVPAFKILAFAVSAFPLLRLALLARLARPATTLARRKISRRQMVVVADRDLRAIRQIGKSGRHHAIAWRQPTRDDSVVLVLLGHNHRLRRDDIVLADDIAE